MQDDVRCPIGSDGGRRGGFTLVELLVVVAIISLLASILVPWFTRAKYLAGEKVCAGQIRGAGIAIVIYAEEHREWYPLEPTEHNPHPDLVATLGKFDRGIINSMYCPQASIMETFAADPKYTPLGDTDSVISTPENRLAGRISYVYWSFKENKAFPAAASGPSTWRNTLKFLPRQLGLNGPRFDPQWVADITAANDPDQMQRYQQCLDASPQETWVMTDFFRRGAPFPHANKHGSGLNIGYLDGHVDLYLGKPKNNYR